MEISGTFNFPRSGIDHDLLFCHRWMDFKIPFRLSCFWRNWSSSRWIFYIFYHIWYCTNCIYVDFPCADCLDRISRCRKGNWKIFQDHYAWIDSFNRDHFHFLSDTVSHSGRWYCSYRYARSVCLFKTRLSRINRKTFSGNSSGCNESVILFLKRIYGNYDHLRFLC